MTGDSGDAQRWRRAGAIVPGVPERTAVSRGAVARRRRHHHGVDAHRDNDSSACRAPTGKRGRRRGNLPSFGSTYVIVEHQRNPNLLFVGTEFGVFVTFNGGREWLPKNLPTVAVHDIVIHPRENDLIIGTHGRSIWILDDIAALEELTPVATSQLFDPTAIPTGSIAAAGRTVRASSPRESARWRDVDVFRRGASHGRRNGRVTPRADRHPDSQGGDSTPDRPAGPDSTRDVGPAPRIALRCGGSRTTTRRIPAGASHSCCRASIASNCARSMAPCRRRRFACRIR
jgi:hypothetical protein